MLSILYFFHQLLSTSQIAPFFSHTKQRSKPKMLKSKRLQLRPWKTEDAPMLLSMWSNAQVTQYMQECKISTLAEAEQYIAEFEQQFAQDQHSCWLVQRYTDKQELEPIGNAGAWMICVDAQGNRIKENTNSDDEKWQQIEVGYEFVPQVWGNGYATEALQCVLDYVHALNKKFAMVAFTDQENAASRRVLCKCGFEQLPGTFIYLGQENCHKFVKSL